ncbi:MAG: BspA family leucine-rich repeat surface protein, partial [Bacilli bacterium]|nr:BspA family leucine-rich repeat surface protein [Bacilli bacterium]
SSEVFTLDLGEKFDTSNVTNMENMFWNTGGSSEVFTLDLGEKFDTSNVTNMENMFRATGSSSEVFTLDLSTFDTSNVTVMSSMFAGASTLKTIYVSDKWNIDNVTESTNMFKNCTSLPNFNSSVVDKTNAHYNTGGYLTLKTN